MSRVFAYAFWRWYLMAVNQRRAGAVLSYISLIVNAAVAFVYVPILLGALSTSEYGIYELIGSVIAYLSVMDAGLSTTLSRFYVKSMVDSDEACSQNLLAMAAVIYGVLTTAAVAVCFGLDVCLPLVFDRSFTAEELDLAHGMMRLVALNCAIVLPGNWFLAVITAKERFVFARSLSIGKYLLQVCGVVLILNWHASAMAVLAVQVACNALVIVCYLVYVRLGLRVRAKLIRWDWSIAGSLFSFSFFILLNMVFDQVFWKTGQVVLGAVCGTAAVASYGIACKLITSAYMQVSTGVTGVFLPKLTAISARTDDMGEINDLFCRIGRIQSILVWAVCVGFIVIGEEFVWLWAGEGYGDVYPATVILMLGLLVSLVQNLGLSVLQAKNKMGFRSVVYITLAVLDVLVSIPVSAEFGVVGCAVVAAALLFLGTGPIMNWYYWKRMGIDIPRFWRETLPLVVPVAITGLIVRLADAFLFDGYSISGFALKFLLFVAVYAAVLWLWFMNDYEKGLVRSALGKIRGMRGRHA